VPKAERRNGEPQSGREVTSFPRRPRYDSLMRVHLAILLSACGAASTPPPSVASPVESGDGTDVRYEGEPIRRSPRAFPEPPASPIRSDAELPEALAETVALLFDRLGAPDPHGLQLHRATLHVGTVWGGDAGSVETMGWLVPGEPVEGRRFVIARNGLLYPAESVGERIGLADYHPSHDERTMLGYEGRVLLYEQGLVWQALLVRAGHVDRALELFENNGAERDDVPLSMRFGATNASEAAADWLWFRIERAVCAHMRGDDPLALHDAQVASRLLAEHREVFEERRAGNVDLVAPLLADQQRRAEGPVRLPRAPGTAPTDVRDPAVRANALVAELDQVAARQWGQPGGVNLAEDVVVRELIALGDVAVEPLLEVVESDARLTRSVHFWRDFARSRTILGVHEAAYAALANILHRDFFETASTGDNLTLRGAEGRRALAATIRDYWERYGDMALHDRWYATLEDDHAGSVEWVRAAASIVTPANLQVSRSSMVGVVRTTDPDAPMEMRGAPLRGRSPSVTELLARRLGDEGDMRARCGIAAALANWDAEEGKRGLSRFLDRCLEAEECRCVPQLANTLADAPGVLRRYATWLDAQEVAEDLASLLAPAVRHGSHPALRRLLPRLFREEGWRHALTYASSFEMPALLRIDAVRSALREYLTDDAVFGELEVGENGSYQVSYENGSSGGVYAEEVEGALPPGSRVPCRNRDWLAHRLTDVDGAPEFYLVWDQARRDEAITALLSWLETTQ